jgi:signal transduction histidine kinase
MERLTAQLLDVSRIEAGALEVRNDPIDLPPLIAEALERCEGRARARGIAVRCEIDDDIPQVTGDHDRLMQVLSNLLGNALKFTHEGRGISVHVARLSGMLQISVEDSGVGIAHEDLPHIFTRFWQANRKSRAGAGLGLAICKGIVEAHGGRIWAVSVVGRGTTVCFTLHAVSHEVASQRGSP